MDVTVSMAIVSDKSLGRSEGVESRKVTVKSALFFYPTDRAMFTSEYAVLSHTNMTRYNDPFRSRHNVRPASFHSVSIVPDFVPETPAGLSLI